MAEVSICDTVFLVEDFRVEFRVLNHGLQTVIGGVVAVPESLNALLKHVKACLGQAYRQLVLRYQLICLFELLSLGCGPTLRLMMLV